MEDEFLADSLSWFGEKFDSLVQYVGTDLGMVHHYWRVYGDGAEKRRLASQLGCCLLSFGHSPNNAWKSCLAPCVDGLK